MLSSYIESLAYFSYNSTHIVKEISCMQHISNRVLSEAYEKALELRLEEDFIELLRSEMVRRGMTPSEQTASSRLQLTK